MTKKLTKLLFLAVLLSTQLFAQSDFRPGFVIKTSGDTLFGLIDYRGDLKMGRVCMFKSNDSTLVQVFNPTDIKGYRFTDSKYFVSKSVNGKPVFLEYLIKGKVNVYYLRDNKDDHYYIEKEDMPLIELPYEEGIKSIDGKLVQYETQKHKGILGYYMQDAKALQAEIQTFKKPEHENLIKLAEDYNNMVCKDEKCIIYEKKLPITKVMLEPVIGITHYPGIYNPWGELGSFLYLSLPRTNERLHFKTGLTYSIARNNGDSLTIIKFPLQFQYLYKVRKIQPKISGGFNVFYFKVNSNASVFYTLSLNAGVDYKLTNKLALTSSINTENVPLGYVIFGATDFYVSHSFYLGMRIDL